MQTALENKKFQGSPLILKIPGRGEYRITLPEGNAYNEILELVCNFWDIPTFNDDIYTGKKVNPDLVSYMEQFETALYAEIEEREEAGAALTLLETLLDANSNPELNAMYKKYLDMGSLPRTVDAEYYGECKSRVDAALAEHALNQGVELSQNIMDIARIFGFR